MTCAFWHQTVYKATIKCGPRKEGPHTGVLLICYVAAQVLGTMRGGMILISQDGSWHGVKPAETQNGGRPGGRPPSANVRPWALALPAAPQNQGASHRHEPACGERDGCDHARDVSRAAQAVRRRAGRQHGRGLVAHGHHRNVQLTPLSWSAKAATCHSFSPSTVFWPLRRLPMVPLL